MKPFIVKRIIDADNHVTLDKNPEILRQVLTQKEASTLTLMLSGATEEGGTGVMAKVDGYPVAGKTGTAQKVNPGGRGYLSKSYISSFAGFVPANNPQFTIYVAVDNPKKQYYGAQVAAPIFNHLASFALHQKGFMPIVVSQSENKLSLHEPLKENSSFIKQAILQSMEKDFVPDFSGLTLREVGRVLQEYEKHDKGFENNVELIGSGLVESQWPAPGSKINKGQKIRVLFHTSG